MFAPNLKCPHCNYRSPRQEAIMLHIRACEKDRAARAELAKQRKENPPKKPKFTKKQRDAILRAASEKSRAEDRERAQAERDATDARE